MKHTDGGNDLALHSELVLETTGEVGDPTATIGRDIWYLPDMVEHVPADEEQDRDQTDSSPDVSVLNNRQHIRPGDIGQREETRHYDEGDDPLEPVDRTLNRWVWATRHVAGEPLVNLLGSLRAGGRLEIRYVKSMYSGLEKTNPLVKSYRRGSADGQA